MQIADTELRAALTVHVRTAWPDVRSVHYDVPMIPASVATLPRAFIYLGNIEPLQGDTALSSTLRHEYTITLLAGRPRQTTVAAEKVARAQALIDQLAPAGSFRYEGYPRRVTSIGFDEDTIGNESHEPIYSVTVGFAIHVLTDG